MSSAMAFPHPQICIRLELILAGWLHTASAIAVLTESSLSQVLTIALALALLTFTTLAGSQQLSSKGNAQLWVLTTALVPNLLNLVFIGLSLCSLLLMEANTSKAGMQYHCLIVGLSNHAVICWHPECVPVLPSCVKPVNVWYCITRAVAADKKCLHAEPATTATMYNRHKLERTVNDDKASQDALKAQPEHKSLSKKFGILHGLSSLANLITIGAAHVHLWYLASA